MHKSLHTHNGGTRDARQDTTWDELSELSDFKTELSDVETDFT